MALSATRLGDLSRRIGKPVDPAPAPAAKPSRPILRLAPKAEPPPASAPEPAAKAKGPAFTPRQPGSCRDRARRRQIEDRQYRSAALDLRTLFEERWPAVFAAKPPLPLAIGIHHAIMAALPEVNPRVIGLALRGHVAGGNYRQALTIGAQRFDLDGNPAGEVTAEHALATGS